MDGVLALSDVDADEIRAAFVVLEDHDDTTIKLSGTVLTIDDETAALTVATDLGDRCIDAGAADVFVLFIEDGRLVTMAADLADLAEYPQLDAFGAEGADGCFDAETILATAAE